MGWAELHGYVREAGKINAVAAAQAKAYADGVYDAWAGVEPDPARLNDGHEEFYMEGYREQRDGGEDAFLP